MQVSQCQLSQVGFLLVSHASCFLSLNKAGGAGVTLGASCVVSLSKSKAGDTLSGCVVLAKSAGVEPQATTPSIVFREFSQIENVDVGVNVDVESHPVGPTTPQIQKYISGN